MDLITNVKIKCTTVKARSPGGETNGREQKYIVIHQTVYHSNADGGERCTL